MNKYQEALDILRGYQYSSPFTSDSVQPSLDDIRKADSFANKEHNRCLDVLQELIDNYNELLDKFNKQNQSYANCCMERKQLEKALEEAIEYHILPECTNEKEKCLDGDCVKCWKEYLLKESEK